MTDLQWKKNTGGTDFNHMVPAKNLGELRWYSGCFFEIDWAKEVLTIGQHTFGK